MNSRTKVFIANANDNVKMAISNILSQIDETQPILKSSKEVYIKVNGVHCKEHCYTSPEVLKATIEHLYTMGASKIFVMEDSTIGNVTRLVFNLTGYYQICKDTRAIPIYLDEDKAEIITLDSQIQIEIPKTVAKIVKNRDIVTYINLPKLKTHNDTVVTLGIKNQFGFVSHKDRKKYHDDRIHSVLVDLYKYIQPDITVIDALEVVSGQLPLAAFKSELVKNLGLLIGGRDTLSVDVVGASILGYAIEEVPHLKLAYTRGLGEGDLTKIIRTGDKISLPEKRTAWEVFGQFPEDIKIIRGTKKICREGCDTNTIVAIQMLVHDYRGKGGFFVLMGQGFEDGIVSQLKAEGYKRGLISGYCAMEEIGPQFKKAFGKGNIYFSDDCCNVAEIVSAVVKLTGRSTFDLAPTSAWKTLYMFISAKLHGSRAILARLF
jgi:uncharacterized protein (DUF362 family)